MRRHRVSLVKCDGKTFLADVGTGCLIPCTPLEFVFDVEQQKNCRNYRIVKDPVFGNLVQAASDEGFTPFILSLKSLISLAILSM